MKGKTKILIQGHLDKKWKDSFEGINMEENSKWLLYNLTVAFSLYWSGNLLLWFPWSINANLGIGLMLTIIPLLWGIGIYYCLIIASTITYASIKTTYLQTTFPKP